MVEEVGQGGWVGLLEAQEAWSRAGPAETGDYRNYSLPNSHNVLRRIKVDSEGVQYLMELKGWRVR